MVLVDRGAKAVGQTIALVLAQNPVPPPDKGEEFGKASPVGLVVILLLGIATALLIRSMTKRLRRLPTSFDPPSSPVPSAAAARPPDADVEHGGPAPGAPLPSDAEAPPDR